MRRKNRLNKPFYIMFYKCKYNNQKLTLIFAFIKTMV